MSMNHIHVIDGSHNFRRGLQSKCNYETWKLCDRIDVMCVQEQDDYVAYTFVNNYSDFGNLRIFYSSSTELLTKLILYLFASNKTSKNKIMLVNSVCSKNSKLSITKMNYNMTNMYLVEKRRYKSFKHQIKTQIKIGLVPDYDESDIEFIIHTLYMRIDKKYINIYWETHPFILDSSCDDDVAFHLKWKDQYLLQDEDSRINKWYQYVNKYNKLIMTAQTFNYVYNHGETKAKNTIVIPRLLKLSRNSDHVKYYEYEHNNLYNAFTFIYLRMNHAAYIIQRFWKQSITNPDFMLCKKRLLSEFNCLSTLKL